MNTLHKTIKISVLFSLIAAGITLAGCASRSSSASTSTTSASSTSVSKDEKPMSASTEASLDSAGQANPATTTTTSSALPGASMTGNAGGQEPIAYDVLMGLIKQGAIRTPAQ